MPIGVGQEQPLVVPESPCLSGQTRAGCDRFHLLAAHVHICHQSTHVGCTHVGANSSRESSKIKKISCYPKMKCIYLKGIIIIGFELMKWKKIQGAKTMFYPKSHFH